MQKSAHVASRMRLTNDYIQEYRLLDTYYMKYFDLDLSVLTRITLKTGFSVSYINT